MYRNFLKTILIVALAASCSESEIDLAPISQESTSNFFTTPNEIDQAVNGAYDALQSTGQYGPNYVFAMEVRSDNSRQGSTTNSGGVFADIDLFRVETTNPIIEAIWNDGYQGIQRANIVLNRIESVENNPNKNIQIGEAKFLRALTYFNLVRLFGDVPLVTVEFEDSFEAFDIGRSPKTEVYTQIIQDLNDAAAALSNTPLRVGGATKGAAYALLGKVHLTIGNFTEASTALSSVTGYSLVPNYQDIFGIDNENNAESIFEVQFTKGGFGEGSPFANLFATNTDQIGGVGIINFDNLPTEDLNNSYDPVDLRKEVTIGVSSDSDILYTKKYMDTPASDRDGENNFIVLRFADVLLMQAEALNEQGYIADGEAFDNLNLIRTRAGLTDLTSVELPTQQSFRDAIANERRWELAFENHRWFDLIRTGKAQETMNAKRTTLTGMAEMATENSLVYPIPQSQIDTSDKLTQNTGY